MKEEQRSWLVFKEALEIADPAKRKAYLDQSCAADPALRQQVEELLDGEQAETLAPQLPADTNGDETSFSAPTPNSPSTHSTLRYLSPFVEEPGSQVGLYRLEELLGEGGFGSVWRASQTEPVRREVAVKLLKLGMASGEVLTRFEAERQALAMMDHAGIAKVFDAGVTENGRPYFVMELSRGVPLTDYCDQQRLDLDQRLQLFIGVCAAVQHAHQKGIIHRDLKPSNILVSEVDGQPQPKVIDFGIAKATEQQLTDNSLHTIAGQLMGTPGYMSPEQATGSSDIDTRSDVYSLGVILYKLLTNKSPHNLEGTPLEVLQQIAKEEIIRPRAQRPGLHQELEAILLKALSRNRDDRYSSAGSLSSELRRFLDGDPISAAPATTIYFLKKRLQKHKVAVSLSLAAMLTVVAGTIFYVYSLNAERANTEEQRKIAVAKARDAEAREQDAVRSQRQLAHKLVDEYVELSLRQSREANPANALLWAAEALRTGAEKGELTEGEELGHHLRIAQLLRQQPIVVAELDLPGSDTSNLAFSPDGRHAALQSDGALHIVSTDSWTTLRQIPLLDGQRPVDVVMPDNDHVLLASAGGVTLYNWRASNSLTHTFAPLFSANGNRTIQSFGISAGAAKFATGNSDGSIHLWDLTNRKLIKEQTLGIQTGAQVAFNLDGSRLAAWANDYQRRRYPVQLFDGTTLEPVCDLHELHNFVDTIAFSQDGSVMVVGVNDRKLPLYDGLVGTRKSTKVDLPNGRNPRSIRFILDDLRIWVKNEEYLSLIDFQANRELRTLREISGFRISPSQMQILVHRNVGGDQLALLNAETGEPAPLTISLPQSVKHFGFCPDESHVFAVTDRLPKGESRVTIWRLPGPASPIKPVQTSHMEERNKHHDAFVMSADGQLLATRSINSEDSFTVWDWSSRRELWRARTTGQTEMEGLAIVDGGRRICMAQSDGDIRLFDLATGKDHGVRCNVGGRLVRFRASPDGRYCFGNFDPAPHRSKLIHIPSGRIVWESVGVWRAHFYADGKRALLYFRGGRGLDNRHPWNVLNMETGVLVQHQASKTLKVPGKVWLRPLAEIPTRDQILINGHLFDSHDDQLRPRMKLLLNLASDARAVHIPARNTVAIADGRSVYQLIDLDSGNPVSSPMALSGIADEAAISPDGNLLAANTRTGKLHIWDVNTAKLLFPPVQLDAVDREVGGQLFLENLTFDPAGRSLIALSIRNDLYVWDLPEIPEASATEWVILANILTGMKIDPKSGVVRLGRTEQQELRKKLILNSHLNRLAFPNMPIDRFLAPTN